MNLGQVYTKENVADFMVGLLDLPKNAAIIDPCFGKGIFIKSLQKANYFNLTGIEIDSETYSKIDFSAFLNCNMLNLDFFRFEPQEPVDGFVLNPPYVRQEEIDDMDVLGVTKAFIQKKCGNFQIYSKANMYLYFIARCITLLKPGGQMVAIFPNAWLKTPDGKGFFLQILQRGSINNLIQVCGNPFVGNPLVDVMILKFTKDVKCHTKEETLIVNDDSLELVDGFRKFELQSLNCVPLSSVAKVRRGLTTGFNKVFINPPLDSEGAFVDILSSPKDVLGYTTRRARFDKLLSLSTTDNITSEIQEYINKSEIFILETGAPKTLVSLINNGKVWYRVSIPEISDIIFPYIIRDNVRFIINDAKVIARDNFYTIKSEYNPLLIMALLNNLFVFTQLELCGKFYGNGLLKIQKYDVDNIVVPNPCNISESDKKALINCSKFLIKTNESKYISDATTILAKYYKIENIEEIYKSQKSNRLKYELQRG